MGVTWNERRQILQVEESKRRRLQVRPVTELVGHEGFWYEQQDIRSKYLRRPIEIEEICFDQFGKMYRFGGKGKDDGDDD